MDGTIMRDYMRVVAGLFGAAVAIAAALGYAAGCLAAH